MRIPWSAFGLDGPPAAGGEWHANFGVDDPQSSQRYRSWASTRHLFSNRPYFGTLAFTGDARTLRLQRVARLRDGNPQVDLELVGDFAPIVTVDCAIYGPRGNSVFARSAPLRDSQTTTFQSPYLAGGEYFLSLTAADEAGHTLFRQYQRFAPEAEFSVDLAHYPYAGEAVVTARIAALQGLKEMRVRLLAGDRVVQSETWTPQANAAADANIILPTTDLDPGEYVVEAEAVTEAGTSAARATLNIFEQPRWWQNAFGVDRSVPPPWTPVTQTATGWAVWGREYQMNRSAVPRQITSRQTPLLAAPMRLNLRAGGETVDLAALEAMPSQSAADAVSLSVEGLAAGITAQLQGVLEFDGCYRLDVDLASATAATIDGLVLEISFMRDVARFALDSDGQSTNISPNTGKTVAKAFRPYHWIGNDDLGLAVFTESDEFWRPHDEQMIEFVPQGDQVLLRWNIVRQPLRLDKPIRLTFGFMASPVRPIVERDPLYPTSFGGNLDPVTFPEMLSYATHRRITPAQGTVECWVARSDGGSGTELLHLGAENAVERGLDVILDGDKLTLNVAQELRLATPAAALGEQWTHLAIGLGYGGPEGVRWWTPRRHYTHGRSAAEGAR